MRQVTLTLLLFSLLAILVSADEQTLNANFLPSQCWDPRTINDYEDEYREYEGIEDWMYGDGFNGETSNHFDLNMFVQQTNDWNDDYIVDWIPPPEPPKTSEKIANNDLRAYYYYLSDPDLHIEIKEECNANEPNFEKLKKLNRHKYVFIDSKGNEVEVVTEEILDMMEPREASSPTRRKKGKDLLLSLVGGGGIGGRRAKVRNHK